MVLSFYPRWKTTANLLEMTENALRHYSVDQVKAATGYVRSQNSAGSDPSIKAIVAQIRGERVGKADAAGYHSAGPENVKPREPQPRDDEWCHMCDSWRLDLREAMKRPGFTPEGWARGVYGLVRRDLAGFDMTHPSSVASFIQRTGKLCGVTIERKAPVSKRTLNPQEAA